MAHDYANRGKKRKPAARKAGPRGNTSAKKAKPAAKTGRRGLPWLVIVSLVLVGGFSFGLYKLAFVKPDPVANQQVVKKQVVEKQDDQATKAKSNAETAKIEADEKEGFDFYKMLPESEVVPPKVEAYKSTPKSAKNHSQYLLQAGSFRSAKDADSLRAKLLLMGMPNVTTSKSISSSGSVWYRVRVGPFPSRSKLNKAQDQMVRMSLQPLKVKVQ